MVLKPIILAITIIMLSSLTFSDGTECIPGDFANIKHNIVNSYNISTIDSHVYSNEFWCVASQGKDVVPTLIELIPDTTLTKSKIYLCATGNETVGELALHLLSEIIHDFRPLDFILKSDFPHSVDTGYCKVYTFMRESEKNRFTMKERVLNWYQENENNLQWVSDSNSPAGGYYRIAPNESKEEETET